MHRRILLFALAVCVLHASQALAQTLTLPEHLAKAVASADMKSSDGTTITATLSSDTNASGDVSWTVSLDVQASSVASMNFDSANLTGITSGDFASFDQYFTGLKSLRLALPASYSGTFTLTLDSLAELDMSGSKADFNLSIYNFPKLESLKANDCSDLKAVNLAAVVPVKEGNDMMAMFGGGGSQESEVATLPLEKLTHIDISGCPELDRLGYVLSTDSGGGMGALFGGGGSSEPAGYKVHSVITIVRDATTYFPEDTSHPKGSASTNPLAGMMGGDTDDDGSIGTYSDGDVNLLPALVSLNMKGSGTSAGDYISEIDIPNLDKLESADFSGMTKLEYIILPAGTTLVSLDLTGDSALMSLDLSDTKGFVFPEGFRTLSGLAKFRMANRPEVDSIDLSPFPALAELDMSNDSLESLDVSGNTRLQKLRVANNEILSLDLSEHNTLVNVDIRNNKLTKIDLSQNTNIRVNSNSAEDSAVSLSAQTRYMDGRRQKFFSFRDAGLGPLDFGNIVVSSIKGDGVNAAVFDPQSGMAAFESYPSLITYDYESGIYYESSSEPVCMNVRLLWDVSDQTPLISPVDARITGRVNGGEITPLVITADSYEAVTWTSSPETLPAGLEKITDGWSFTIGGEPTEAYDGILIVTARNDNGESESATVRINIAPASENTNTNTPAPSPSPSPTTVVVPTPSPVSDNESSSPDAQVITVSPVSAEITASADSGAIAPIVITADSYTPVTWTSYPEEMPAGLEKTINGRVVVISGTPNAAFSGYVVFAATNEAGNSGYSAVKIEIAPAVPDEPDSEPVSDDVPDIPDEPEPMSDDTSAPEPEPVSEDTPAPEPEPVSNDTASNDVHSSSSGGGCNSGFGALLLAGLVLKLRVRR